jgi:hypothetical protein
MDVHQPNIQALIVVPEALNWNDTSQLETIPVADPPQAYFRLIIKLLSFKTPNFISVCD